MELGPYGIRVNVVAPGYIDVRGWSEAFPDRATDEMRARLVASIPLGRSGQPTDIASAVLFLASDAAAHITGTVLEVDGGSNAGRPRRSPPARRRGTPVSVASESAPIIETTDLIKVFHAGPARPGRPRPLLRAVDGVTLTIRRGETLALVGETGSGKTTFGRLLLGLYRPTSGDIRYRGTSILDSHSDAARQVRREVQGVFQDPYSSLNPTMTVGQTLAEVLKVHHVVPRGQRADRIAELLTTVGLVPDQADRKPVAFSGGQRQRVGIAPRARGRARDDRRGRAAVRAGCLDPGADPQPDDQAAGRTGPHLPVRHPRPGRDSGTSASGPPCCTWGAWSSWRRPRRCSPRRCTPTPRPLVRAAPRVSTRAQDGEASADRRPPERHRPAVRLPLPPALPDGDASLPGP